MMTRADTEIILVLLMVALALAGSSAWVWMSGAFAHFGQRTARGAFYGLIMTSLGVITAALVVFGMCAFITVLYG